MGCTSLSDTQCLTPLRFNSGHRPNATCFELLIFSTASNNRIAYTLSPLLPVTELKKQNKFVSQVIALRFWYVNTLSSYDVIEVNEGDIISVSLGKFSGLLTAPLPMYRTIKNTMIIFLRCTGVTTKPGFNATYTMADIGMDAIIIVGFVCAGQ